MPETISKLRRPELGSYNLWDHIEGERNQAERYSSGVILPESGQLAVVMERSNPEEPKFKTLYLQEVDRRGRSEWIKELTVKNATAANKLMLWKDQLVVFADVEEKGQSHVWIGFHDMKGELLHEATIKDKKFNFSAREAVKAIGDKEILVALQAEPKSPGSATSAILYWINDKGRVQRSRAFMLGMVNEISSIKPTSDGRYIMAGSIETANGNSAGWLVNIDNDGSIRWQRPYSRGRSSEFKQLKLFAKERYAAVIGDALPGGLDGGRRSGWIMVAALSDGEPAWQRYYREDADVTGMGINTQEDGQINVLMGVEKNDDSAVYDYVRLVTLNPRGVILSSRSYQNGVGVNAAGMVIGNKAESVIYGSSVLAYTEKETQPDGFVLEKEVRSREAWAVAAAPTEVYVDPCVQPQ